MARKSKPASANKEPGRIKQMGQVFSMTRKHDPAAVWYIALATLAPILAAVGISVVFTRDNVIAIILWVVLGVMSGILLGMIVLGRRAERAAYGQIAGQPGAVGAVFRGSLPRSWSGTEMPVHVSPRTQDAVYRAVGRGGVVLVGEGPVSRTKRIVEEERRKIARILPNVEITTLYVGPDEDSVPLHRIPKTIRQIKKTLTKPERAAVLNRLSSLNSGKLPIPKGVDPFRTRPQRAR